MTHVTHSQGPQTFPYLSAGLAGPLFWGVSHRNVFFWGFALFWGLRILFDNSLLCIFFFIADSNLCIFCSVKIVTIFAHLLNNRLKHTNSKQGVLDKEFLAYWTSWGLEKLRSRSLVFELLHVSELYWRAPFMHTFSFNIQAFEPLGSNEVMRSFCITNITRSLSTPGSLLTWWRLLDLCLIDRLRKELLPRFGIEAEGQLIRKVCRPLNGLNTRAEHVFFFCFPDVSTSTHGDPSLSLALKSISV